MKYIKWVLVILYIYFILTKTIIGRNELPERIVWMPFREYSIGAWSDIINNILLFIPLGFLIGGWKGIICGALLSVFIESTQYVFKLGYCELDDILNNTIGAGMGAAVMACIRRFRERNDTARNKNV